MPELPEVEITRLALGPWLQNRIICSVQVRERRLRWPVSPLIDKRLPGAKVTTINRRGKYLLFETSAGYLMVHLGMSGSLQWVPGERPAGKHDHIDIAFDGGVLRFCDPRRFGSFHWIEDQPWKHPLLNRLGLEPLHDAFDGDYLYRLSRGRKVSVKNFIMNARVVVGVGNIYASESLYLAGIRPQQQAGGISRQRYRRLARAIKQVLGQAIEAGGTTLRDFVSGEGRPGYFQLKLQVYNRAGLACRQCGRTVKSLRLGQRSTFFCPSCQR